MAIIEETASQILAAFLVYACICWYFSRRRCSASRLLPGTRVPPCFKSVPILGSLPFISVDANNLHKYFTEQRKNYGNIFALYLGSTYTVVLNGAECIREALLKKSVHFADRPRIFSSRYFNSDRKGVLVAPYDERFRQKRQLYLSIMKQFGFGQRLMETRINGEVNELIKQARLKEGDSFDPNDMLHLCVVNVIASILLGKRYNFDDPTLKTLQQTVYTSVSVAVPEIELFPVLRFVPSLRKRWIASHNLSLDSIALLAQEIDKVIHSDETNDSFVQQFIASTPVGEEYDREELLQTARDLIMAGDDTSSTTLRWILLHLANYPDVQSRLQREVDAVVGFDRLPLLADEINMPYTQAFILETMRRRTLAPLSVFHRTACDTQVGDFFIPIGAMVLVNLYSAHMDPDKWNEPDAFKPERFISDSGQIFGKDRIMPFSIGKRSCLGESLARQELFLFTSGIVQNFDVRPPEGQRKIACDEVTHFVTEPSAFHIRMIERTH